MRKPFVAGNWKMNKTSAQGVALVNELLPAISGYDRVERVVCPSFLSVPAVSARLQGSLVGVGTQDLYWETSGAYTGEVAPDMVKEFCQYVIIGHSERRAKFGETDETVNKKVKAALAAGLVVIMCVGETLEENEAGQTEAVVSRQVREGLNGLVTAAMENVVIAYEPVWAIGTGRAASAEGANAVIKDFIRKPVAALFDEKIAHAVRVLYGGSVTGANAMEFFSQPDIDGALVGGASLKPVDFTAIVAAAAER
ncbi:MAG TPA: triose-phosphate isomerase [Anaerolineaceae bacterium]|nr:triose-phosphate isomerase [Anaerolineaceae bacterium]